MTDTQKRIAAAMAAVMHYLRAEEELAAAQYGQSAAGAVPPPAGPNPWALNGRQTQMQLRNLMQFRALGRMT